jgi:hypothetical protein
MSYGSNAAVEDAMGDYREKCAQQIAWYAAELVAARDVGRQEAIKLAAEWLREELTADDDPTGVNAVDNAFPFASKDSKSSQVAAIAAELVEAARDAADSL